jgi:hypothetical protein
MRDTLSTLRLQRGCEHLHGLGPRALAEFLNELGGRIGGRPCIAGLLAEWEGRLTPRMVRAAGGDCPPPTPTRMVLREARQ